MDQVLSVYVYVFVQQTRGGFPTTSIVTCIHAIDMSRQYRFNDWYPMRDVHNQLSGWSPKILDDRWAWQFVGVAQMLRKNTLQEDRYQNIYRKTGSSYMRLLGSLHERKKILNVFNVYSPPLLNLSIFNGIPIVSTQRI